MVRWMSKKSCFRRAFDKQYGKRLQTLMKSAWQHPSHIYWSLWRKFSYKKSLFVICKILGLSVNTLTPDDKYCLLKRDNLIQLIHLQLSKEQNLACQLISAFLKSRSNLKHFEEKGDPHSLCVSDIAGSKRCG